MKITGGEGQRADPRGKSHAERDGKFLCRPSAGPLWPTPEFARQEGIRPAERFDPALNFHGEPDDGDDDPVSIALYPITTAMREYLQQQRT